MEGEVRKDVPCEVPYSKRVGVLPCSGACNVGMLTTRAVVELVDRHDNINFVCALGLPLGVPGIVANAKKSDVYIALNGCDVKCSSRALNSIDLPIDAEVVVTKELGVQKSRALRDNDRLNTLVSKTEEIMKDLESRNLQ